MYTGGKFGVFPEFTLYSSTCYPNALVISHLTLSALRYIQKKVKVTLRDSSPQLFL